MDTLQGIKKDNSDNILKSFGVEDESIEKARSGVYADTVYNRRKGLVGKKFGEEHQSNDVESKKQKKENTSSIDDYSHLKTKAGAEEKLGSLQRELERTIKMINDRKSFERGKFQNPNKRRLSNPISSFIKKLIRDKDKTLRQIEGVKFNNALAKKVLQDSGLNIIKRSSTAIRGFTHDSEGYEFDEMRNTISINTKSETFNKVSKELKRHGFELDNISEPSRSVGGGNYGTIKLKPYNYKD